MPLSWVTAIELKNNNTLTVYVRVDGFEPQTPVEISGYVTQENGAVATFYDVQKMPSNAGAADMEVKNVRAAAGAVKFDTGIPVTVVARAADVWISTLGPAGNAAGIQERSKGVKARWNSTQGAYYSALFTTKAASLAATGPSWKPAGPPGEPTSTPSPK